MAAMWIDDESQLKLPDGYVPVGILGLPLVDGNDTSLMIAAPVEWLGRADALSVADLLSDAIKQELRDVIKPGRLKRVQVDPRKGGQR